MRLGDSFDNLLRRSLDFHGRHAPGLVIGCHMVEYGLELLGEIQGELNAVVETSFCLPDAVQVMTGCTLGNKNLRLQDHIGRFACALYDRKTGRGVRVYLDVKKIDRTTCPELFAFHMRQRDPKVQTDRAARRASGERVLREFESVRRGVLSYQRVQVGLPAKEPMFPSVLCTRCGEPFLTLARPEEAVCAACYGESYCTPSIEASGS